MGNPLQTIPLLPPAITLDGTEQLWLNQAGVDRRATSGQIASLLLGEIGAGGSGLTVANYAQFRASAFPVVPGGPMLVVTLTDPTKPGIFVPIPKNGAQTLDNGGTIIVDSLGQPWERIYSGRINAGWFFNFPGHTFGEVGYNVLNDTTLKITAADIAANPQWIGMPDGSGMYPVGTNADYVALQEWIYACAAVRSSPGSVVWNASFSSYQLSQPGFCPTGLFTINQQLVCTGSGLDFDFASRQGGVISWIGNALGTDNTGPAVLFNSLTYSFVTNLAVIDHIGAQTCVVSLDHNAALAGWVPGGLDTQKNTFNGWFIGGNVQFGMALTQAGVGVALSGGGAQGDTQVFINCTIVNCLSGLQIGGDNAIGILILGGDWSQCQQYGVANVGAGSYTAINLLFEANPLNFFGFPQINQITMDGCDHRSSEVTSENSTVINGRSESIIAAIDTNNLLELHNYPMSQAAGFGPWSAEAHNHIGYSETVAGNGFQLVTCVDDGGYPWFVSDPASTTTRIINPNNPGWTPNQWAGYGVWLRFGSNGFCNSNGIISSDANSITVAVPFSVSGVHGFKIFGKSGLNPPNWGAVATTSYGRAARNATGQGYSMVAGNPVLTGATPPPLGAWAMICNAGFFTLQAGSNQPILPMALIGKVASVVVGATWVGSVFGSVMTVTSVTSGVIQVGALVSIPNAAFSTYIASQLSGTPGGVGTYSLAHPFQTPNSPQYLPMASSFAGSISGNTLTVTSVPGVGPIAIGQRLHSGLGLTGVIEPTVITGMSSANVTASISVTPAAPTIQGNQLNVTAATGQPIAIGQTVTGAGVAAGTTIISQISGTAGGIGVYGLSGLPQLVASEAMTVASIGAGGTYTVDTAQTVASQAMTTTVPGATVAMAHSSTFTLADAWGNPQVPGVTRNDGMGYWGQPIYDAGAGVPGDGGMTWIPVDFDVVWGCKRVRGCEFTIGRAGSCGLFELDSPIMAQTSGGNFIRPTETSVPNFDYNRAPRLSMAPVVAQHNEATFTFGVSFQSGFIGSTQTMRLNVLQSTTWNFPLLGDTLDMNIDLFITGAANVVITWGTNVTAATPTVALGATAQKMTIVRMKWIGNRAGGGGWWVMGVNGPM